MKKILVNCLHITNEASGVKNRIIQLYAHLSLNKKYKISFLIHRDVKFDYEIPHNITFIKTNLSSASFIQRYLSSKKIVKEIAKKEKFHFYDHSFLPFISYPGATSFFTIHDLRYLNKKLSFNFCKYILFKYLTNWAIIKADKVLTVSNFIKKSIEKNFKFSKIFVIPNFLNPLFLKKTKKKRLFQNSYLLTIGHLEKRKNILFLIDAYSDLLTKNIYTGKLLLATSSGDIESEVEKKIQILKLNKKVVILKNLNNDKIINLYDHADCFIFPSMYEGFGIPILEALSRNCKLLLSNNQAFKEVTLNKFIYFNFNSIKDFQNKFISVISSKINHKRKKTILKKYSIIAVSKLFQKKILNT